MSDEKTDNPQYFSEIRVFLNPYLFGEMKEVKRRTKIHKGTVNEKNIVMRFLIIHMAIDTCSDIGQKYVALYETAPEPVVTFRRKVSWRKNTIDALHNFYRTPQGAGEQGAPIKLFQIPYYDVERIEHEDGTVLWQKKR